ncbi:hypothetical protein QUC31_003013 [Theobroma cacao]|uniref:Uncharacterized protein isoform 1 n=1 Tax=Theobroma cacao TaxID=3641 RepID=A0A061DMS1_THECC|nr:Uncharacterized protein TCM_000506 isoform 1 [Theobroma cacao]WRX10621.1 hypothetical protein QQP08_003108 [Theobroma cacao]
MSGREEDNDSDAPEEFTNEQGLKQDEEIRKIQKENKARFIREGKERRRHWAQKKTPRQSAKKVENGQEDVETGMDEESQAKKGMLPTNIVEMLASREKQVFLSDSEDEKTEVKHTSRKKKKKSSGLEPVILEDIPPARCLQNSLEFLKKRKMQVPRSSSVLNYSNQALRLNCVLTTSGLRESCKRL